MAKMVLQAATYAEVVVIELVYLALFLLGFDSNLFLTLSFPYSGLVQLAIDHQGGIMSDAMTINRRYMRKT